MARKHLFISYAEISKYYPFQDTVQFEDLFPTLKLVERTYFRGSTANFIDLATWLRVLGELDSQEENEPAEYWGDLAERICQAAAYLVALRHMAKSNVMFGSAGLLVAKTENAVPASEYRTEELKAALMKDAQTSLDQIVEYLEENLAVFSDWASSDERGDLNGLIIRTAGEFDRVYSINENRWIFRKLIPRQRMIIRAQVRAQLGKEFVAAFIADMADGALNADHESIVDQLHSAVAKLTFSESLPMLGQQFGPEGIAIFDSNLQRMASRRQDGDLDRLKFLQNDVLEKGLQELRDLRNTLNKEASATKFPEYFNSDSYADPSIDETDLNSDDNKGYFAL